MRYLYWGIAILALCLILCVVCTALLGVYTQEVTAVLERARDAASAGDFDAAARLAVRAQCIWESHRGFFGMTLRHHIQEEFEPVCADLIEQIQHLYEMEMPYFYNILTFSGFLYDF